MSGSAIDSGRGPPGCLREGTPREQIPYWLREGNQGVDPLLAQGGDPYA